MENIKDLRLYKLDCTSAKKKITVKLILMIFFYLLGLALIIPGIVALASMGSQAGLFMVVLGLFACGGGSSSKKALKAARKQQS